MIKPSIVTRVALSVCAIERCNLTLAEMRARGWSNGEKIELEQDVIGTGFIVSPGWVLTNRHVVECIQEDVKRRGEKNLDHWFLEWVHPSGKEGGLSSTIKSIMLAAPLTGQGHSGLDVALIRYTHHENEMAPCRPVQLGTLETIRPGMHIAICGYLSGNDLLRGIPGGPRFGPVVHSGIVSAVAPHATSDPRDLRALLTDFNTGGGFSGSPLFHPGDGRVIGIHHSGSKYGTFGIGLPLDKQRADGWVAFVEEELRQRGRGAATAEATGGGDIRTSGSPLS